MTGYIKAWIKYFRDLREYKRLCKLRKYLPRAAYSEMFVKRMRAVDDQLHATYTAPSQPYVMWIRNGAITSEPLAQETNREILARIMNTPEEA